MLLQIIREYSFKGGIFQTKITEKSGLTRQTVFKTLKKLMAEDKIDCSNRKYYAKEDVESYFSNNLFAAYLNDQFKSMMTIKKLPKEGLAFAIGKFTANDLAEKNIFTFANVIGAFIIYVLIESKRPNQQNIENIERRQLTRHMIDVAVSLEDILYGFQNYLTSNHNNNTMYDEMTKDDFAKVYQAFNKVYPSMFMHLEEDWKTFCTSFIETLPLDNKYKHCDHKWDEHYMYKFGKYYECSKCHVAADLDVSRDRKN
jgi:hypothetical protein